MIGTIFKVVVSGAATAVGIDAGRAAIQDVRKRYRAAKARAEAKQADDLEELKRQLDGQTCPECRGSKTVPMRANPKLKMACGFCGGDGVV